MSRDQDRLMLKPARFPGQRRLSIHLRLSAISATEPCRRACIQPCDSLQKGVRFTYWFPKPPVRTEAMARRPQKLPDYFTFDEAEALVAAAPGYPKSMAFRIMLRTGLRVSNALSLRRSDLRLGQKPPVISIRPEAPGNKSRKGGKSPSRRTCWRARLIWPRFAPRTGTAPCWTSPASG